MKQQHFSGRLIYIVLGGLILVRIVFSSVPPASAGRPFPSPAIEITEALTNTPSFTPTATEIPSIICGNDNLGGACQQINSTTIGGSYQWAGDMNNWYNNSGTFGRFNMAAVSHTTTVYVTWWESTVGMNSFYGVNRVYDVYNYRNSAALEKIANDVLLPGKGSSSYSQVGPKYYTFTLTTGNSLYLYNSANRSGSLGSYEGHGTFTVYVSTSGFYEHPTSTATATLTSTPTSTPTAVPTVTPNYYYGYLGPGYFSNNNLSYCNTGAYSQQTQNASSQWSIDTDINMFNNCTSIQVNVIYADFGNTNWVGRAHICNTSGQCDSNEAYNSTYSYCQVWLNSNVIAGNPFFYTDTEVQKLIMHEFGHCFSLDHSTDPTSVMGNGNVPNTIDIDMINARY